MLNFASVGFTINNNNILCPLCTPQSNKENLSKQILSQENTFSFTLARVFDLVSFSYSGF